MKFTLVRNIYFHSPTTGLVSTILFKEIESDIAPQIGFEFEDSAWHRKDPIKAESISINSENGKCSVQLNSKEVAAASDVKKLCNTAVQHHGWKIE